MAEEYRLFFLTPGQMAPEGSTGVSVNNGLVWIGESGTFPLVVKKGKKLSTDQEISNVYNNRLMTEVEIYLYNNPPTSD